MCHSFFLTDKPSLSNIFIFLILGAEENICVVDSNEIYRVGDIWESGGGCKKKICRCTQLPNGTTSIQCQSECPPLSPNAHIPTARCPHPTLVKPDGPCSCPYVSCDGPPPPRRKFDYVLCSLTF